MNNDDLGNVMKKLLLILTMVPLVAFAGIADKELEGARDGKLYAIDLLKKGIPVDGTACAVGMGAEDKSRPHYTQKEIQAYAKAYGNACMGRKVF